MKSEDGLIIVSLIFVCQMLMLLVRFFLIDSLSFSASGIGLFRRLLVVSRVRVVRVVFLGKLEVS